MSSRNKRRHRVGRTAFRRGVREVVAWLRGHTCRKCAQPGQPRRGWRVEIAASISLIALLLVLLPHADVAGGLEPDDPRPAVNQRP